MLKLLKRLLGLEKIWVRRERYSCVDCCVVEAKRCYLKNLGFDEQTFSQELARELGTNMINTFWIDHNTRGVKVSISTYPYLNYDPICYVFGFEEGEVEEALKRVASRSPVV
ncbi:MULTISPECIES: hypothetical protein [unclassified Archaeoglobus]|uniref:hypothetical protein n=1 Tax=unclassified Archaeoglobus TaxID=2643606 RepID=UPI0025C159D5|nr:MULTISPECIES: hypothetical protein [unclassified Archaeoglobus]